jgi:hypothetical protein
MSMSFSQMYDESERGKRVWMQEYFVMGKFSGAYQREANILHDAVHYVLNLLNDDDPAQAKAVERLKAELNKANTVRLDAVKPLKKLELESVQGVFDTIAQAEGFEPNHPLTKRFQALFMLGAIVGFERCKHGIDDEPVAEPEPINYVSLMKELAPPVVKRRLLDDDEPAPAPKRRSLLEED